MGKVTKLPTPPDRPTSVLDGAEHPCSNFTSPGAAFEASLLIDELANAPFVVAGLALEVGAPHPDFSVTVPLRRFLEDGVQLYAMSDQAWDGRIGNELETINGKPVVKPASWDISHRNRMVDKVVSELEATIKTIQSWKYQE